ncbi:LuxR C-terminal-related transcriptional regulator [Mucilaginibacter sp.]|uniref:response regulator transcription factor n=1 Tax=Mucilaginibacter sp. TaxID=1882438 RepID=UPI00284E8C17|nr:LuxR C-terminal-related transcriptional regulator [Mucilaginibacter sp.]MDR3693581.1 LuxR C-terminal-related transcriptional regulator [Mucilaginibacter sp.]
MTSPALRTSIKIGIATALAIILFQISNIFLVYKYFKFEYYITAIAVLFLITGFFISKYDHRRQKNLPAGIDPLTTLTNKELTILQQIVNGKSNKEIAAANYVEISTIKTHINNIYTKLGIRNRREAVNYYREKL